MTQTSIAGPVSFPNFYTADILDTSSTQLVMDASGEKIAVMFRVPKTGTLNGCGFRIGNSTQIPSSGVRVSFQDRNAATGFPDGTQDQYRVVTGMSANTWVEPGLVTSDGTDGGSKRSVTAGDLMCIVIEFESFAASDVIRLAVTNANGTPFLHPGFALYTSSWAGTARAGCVALIYSDGSYVNPMPFGLPPASAITTTNVSSSTTPDEVALIFVPSVPMSVCGAWILVDLDANADLVLYDSGGSTLASVSLDAEDRRGTARGTITALFSSTVDLSAGSTYRLAFKPSTTTNDALAYYDVTSTAAMGACEGGADWHWSQRTDAGSWTETNTRRPFIGLLIDKFSDGAGGGSGGYSRARVVNV